ncbi:MAG TPA: hypothetical protein VHF06_26705 [Pseudonocardiaceae bacterium]|jgi:hypothetical protein|nr:hypothetical protein [Pseudonocardiaceae bacterium]
MALLVADSGKPEHPPVASVVTLTAVRKNDGWRATFTVVSAFSVGAAAAVRVVGAG